MKVNYCMFFCSHYLSLDLDDSHSVAMGLHPLSPSSSDAEPFEGLKSLLPYPNLLWLLSILAELLSSW